MATPLTAAAVVVPLIVACDDTVMLAVLWVMFPKVSSTATLTEGDIMLPATMLDGC